MLLNAGQAQQKSIDSLKFLYSKEKLDTHKVVIDLNIAALFSGINPDSSIFYCHRAIAFSNEKKLNKMLAASYRHMGKMYRKKNDFKTALECYTLSLNEYQKLNDKKNIGDCYNYIGNMYNYMGDYAKALENYLLSVKFNEEIGEKQRVANAFSNIGVIQMRQKSYKQAIETYEKNTVIYRSLGDSSGVATCYKNLGVIFAEQNIYEKALYYYFKVLDLELKGFHDTGDLTGTYSNIATVYSNWKKYPKALEYWQKSYKLAEKSEDTYTRFYSFIGFGATYIETGDFQKGIEMMHRAKDEALKGGLKYELMDIYRSLANAYDRVKDSKNAYKFERMRSDLKDSIHNEENSNAIAEMQSKYESEKKDKELLKKEAEIKHQSLENVQKATQRNFLIVGFVLMGFLAFFIFRGYRNKQKSVVEISEQKKIIEEKNKDITDSINYAKRIQEVILPSPETNLFKESFILYKPKDVVSGDFYWYGIKNNKKIITAVDCTGHGVPGALMSMIGFSFLNEAVNEEGLTQPAQILSRLRDKVKSSLKQTGEIGESKDGMDMALLSFNEDNSVVEFCGAHNPLWLIRKEGPDYNLTEYAADKRPVGYFMGKSLPFTNKTIELRTGDSLYVFSDGYADQFGGPKGKKFKYQQLKSILVSIQEKPMNEQKEILLYKFLEWKKDFEQVDDVLVIGIRV